MLLAAHSLRSASLQARRSALLKTSRSWLSTSTTDPTSGKDDKDETSPPAEVDVPPVSSIEGPKDDVQSVLEKTLRPSEVVKELDRHIVGQPDAKRAVAIAMRNRWRRRQLPADLMKEVTPRNVLMIGPTGCGKVCLIVFSIIILFVVFPFRS